MFLDWKFEVVKGRMINLCRGVMFIISLALSWGSMIPLSFIMVAHPVYAEEEEDFSFEGFEDFVEEDETSDVVIIFGRDDLGTATSTFNDETLRFDDPAAMLQILRPYIKQASANVIVQALEEPLETNMARLCKEGPICGFLLPKVLGIIFDRNNYKVSLFINPEYLVKRKYAQAKFLDDSTAGWSAMSQFQHNLTGDGEKNVAYSLNNRIIVGEGNWDYLAESNFTFTRDAAGMQERQWQFQELLARWRKGHHKAQLGIQDTVSTLIIPQLRIIGVSFQTDNTLLENSSEQISSPVEVSLTNPSYIEIFRNGNLLNTQYYPPGNHFIDTSLLPQGAYNITLKIKDIVGNERTRSLFFVKTNALPLSSLPEYYVSYGRLQSLSSDKIIPTITDIDVITVESDQRIHKFFGISEHLSVFEYSELLGELEFITQLPDATIIVSGGASNFGDYGAGLILNTNVYDMAISTIYRRIWANEQSTSKVINQYLTDSNDTGSNLGIGFSKSWQNYDFSGAVSTGYSNGEIQHGLNLGIARTFELGGRSSFSTSLSGNWDTGDKGLIATISWNFGMPYDIEGSLSMTGQVTQPQGQNSQKTGTISIGASKEFMLADTRNNYAIQATSAVGSNYLSQSLSSQGSAYRVSAQNSIVSTKTGNTMFYNINAFNSLVYTPPTNYDWSGSDLDSGVVVRVDAPIESEFAVFDKSNQLLEIESNKSYFIPLANFKRHTIQMVSQNDTLTVEDPEREIILFDGNVHTLTWKAREAFLLIGTFIYPDGVPVANNDIEGGIEFGQTDEDGFAQVEIMKGDNLTFTSPDGLSCTVDTNTITPEEGVAYEDTVTCEPNS
ncbi:TcfC E-set like domain-containing protein [Francisellaceae bacterium]|nr:TcfC E-set like domain-containing protein [Francisellaceae bacterium]